MNYGKAKLTATGNCADSELLEVVLLQREFRKAPDDGKSAYLLRYLRREEKASASRSPDSSPYQTQNCHPLNKLIRDLFNCNNRQLTILYVNKYSHREGNEGIASPTGRKGRNEEEEYHHQSEHGKADVYLAKNFSPYSGPSR